MRSNGDHTAELACLATDVQLQLCERPSSHGWHLARSALSASAVTASAPSSRKLSAYCSLVCVCHDCSHSVTCVPACEPATQALHEQEVKCHILGSQVPQFTTLGCTHTTMMGCCSRTAYDTKHEARRTSKYICIIMCMAPDDGAASALILVTLCWW